MPENTYSPSGDDAGDDLTTVRNDALGDTERVDVTTSVDAMDNVRDLVDIPSIEIVTRAIVMLMSASAEKLGLAPGASEDDADLDPPERHGRIIILTSGTTGTPKGAPRSEAGIDAAVALVRSYLR